MARLPKRRFSRGVAYNAEGKAEADMGIGWGDANGDLLPDLFVTHLTRETHTLWVEESPGLFQDRTAAAHLAAADWHATGFGTTMQDFDHDGALDIAARQRPGFAKPAGRSAIPNWDGIGACMPSGTNCSRGTEGDISATFRRPILRFAGNRTLPAAWRGGILTAMGMWIS